MWKRCKEKTYRCMEKVVGVFFFIGYCLWVAFIIFLLPLFLVGVALLGMFLFLSLVWSFLSWGMTRI